MRIALISDIHGNEVALKAVMADINRVGVDSIVCLGDVATLGPRPSPILEMLGELDCPCILGNHDAFMLDPNLIHTYTEVPVIVEAVDWCRGRLSQSEFDFIRGFRSTMEIALDVGSTLFLFHGSPRSHMEDLLATTPPDALEEMLAGHCATVMAGGHTHIQMTRQHRGILIVNPGSVGLPFKEYVSGQAPTLMHHAEYAIVESTGGSIDINLRRVPLDILALREAVAATDNPLGRILLQQYA